MTTYEKDAFLTLKRKTLQSSRTDNTARMATPGKKFIPRGLEFLESMTEVRSLFSLLLCEILFTCKKRRKFLNLIEEKGGREKK